MDIRHAQVKLNFINQLVSFGNSFHSHMKLAVVLQQQCHVSCWRNTGVEKIPLLESHGNKRSRNPNAIVEPVLF